MTSALSDSREYSPLPALEASHRRAMCIVSPPNPCKTENVKRDKMERKRKIREREKEREAGKGDHLDVNAVAEEDVSIESIVMPHLLDRLIFKVPLIQFNH